jgi:hypothetical protein
MFFSTSKKVFKKAFKGGLHGSKIGKQLKSIPKNVLNSRERKTLYKTLEKRGKSDGLTRGEVEGALRELAKSRKDNISKKEVKQIKNKLGEITGYGNLSANSARARKDLREMKKQENLTNNPELSGQEEKKGGLFSSFFKKSKDTNLQEHSSDNQNSALNANSNKNISQNKVLNKVDSKNPLVSFFTKDKSKKKLNKNGDQVNAADASNSSNNQTSNLANTQNFQKYKNIVDKYSKNFKKSNLDNYLKNKMSSQKNNQTDYNYLDNPLQTNDSQSNGADEKKFAQIRDKNLSAVNFYTQQKGDGHQTVERKDENASINQELKNNQAQLEQYQQPDTTSPDSTSSANPNSANSSIQEPIPKSAPNIVNPSIPVPPNPNLTSSPENKNEKEEEEEDEDEEEKEEEKTEAEKAEEIRKASEGEVRFYTNLQSDPNYTQERKDEDASVNKNLETRQKELEGYQTPEEQEPQDKAALEKPKDQTPTLMIISILVQKREKTAFQVNEVLTNFGHLFLGRMGIPLARKCREDCSSLITLMASAPTEDLNQLLINLESIDNILIKKVIFPSF